jgi:cytochrome b involved in lipid metabolism
MADTFSAAKYSPETTQSKRCSKNVIILIILASIGFSMTIEIQGKNTNTNPDVEVNSVTKSESVNTPIESVNPEFLAKNISNIDPNNIVTKQQLEVNSKIESCWAVVDDIVYDISDFIKTNISQTLNIKATDVCGKDATKILSKERSDRPPMGEDDLLNPYSRPIGILEQ